MKGDETYRASLPGGDIIEKEGASSISDGHLVSYPPTAWHTSCDDDELQSFSLGVRSDADIQHMVYKVLKAVAIAFACLTTG